MVLARSLPGNIPSVLPTWFREFPHDANGNPENNKPQWEPIKTGKITSIAGNDVIGIETGGLMLPLSKQELAIYEILEAVPKLISFDHAAKLFQGLINLSPRKVQSLLERSNSIKATNRLFLFLAAYYQMLWLSRLNGADINLGSGKRQIIKGASWTKLTK